MNRRILLIVLLSIVMGRSCPAEKVTIDPNTLDAQVAPTQQEGDERLAQKVTYTADGKAIRTILADLTELTGVKFYAGSNSGDWQARDRRMRILVKDLPLAHLMNSMARVMKFKWSCSKEKDVRSYRLYADQESLSEEQNLLKRWERLRRDRPREQMESALKAFEGLKSRYEEDPEALRKDNPLLYAYAKSGAADTVLRLCKDIPGLKEALVSGRQVTFPGTELPDGVLDDLPQIVRSFAEFGPMSAVDHMMSGQPSEAPTADEIGDFPVHRALAFVATNELKRDRDLADDDLFVATVPADIIAGCIMQAGAKLTVMAPSSRFWQLATEAALEAHEKGLAYLESRQAQARLDTVMREEREKLHTGEPKNPRPQADLLNTEIPLANEDKYYLSLADYQKQFAAACSLSIVSDSFPETGEVYASYMPETGKLGDLLDTVSDPFDYNWDYADTVLEFRDRYWFVKRAEQLSDAWLDKLQTKLKRDGRLDIDDMAEIAALSRQRIEASFGLDDDLRGLASRIEFNQPILCLYASLTQTQRQALLTDAGLDVRAFSPRQAEYVEILLRRSWETFMRTPARLREKVEVSEGGIPRYEFTLTDADGEEIESWRLYPYPYDWEDWAGEEPDLGEQD